MVKGCIGTALWAVVTMAAVNTESPEVTSVGLLRLPVGVQVTLIDPQQRDLQLTGAAEALHVPPGRYRVLHWAVERRDEHGQLWRLQARDIRQTEIQVVAGQDSTLDIGEPGRLLLVRRRDGQQLRFTCWLQGQMGEALQLIKPGTGAVPPQLHIANQDATFQHTLDFSFG